MGTRPPRLLGLTFLCERKSPSPRPSPRDRGEGEQWRNLEPTGSHPRVAAAGFPPSVVGVIIALLVLLPETLAAVRAARRDRVQTSFNLALGSAMASISLTIPAIAFASIWLSGPIVLGLAPTQIVLLVLTVVVATLTVVPGWATLMQAGVHIVVFASFIFFAIKP